MFEAIEEGDKIIEKEDGLPPALLGSCNDRAKHLHNSPSGNSRVRKVMVSHLFTFLLGEEREKVEMVFECVVEGITFQEIVDCTFLEKMQTNEVLVSVVGLSFFMIDVLIHVYICYQVHYYGISLSIWNS